MSGESNMKPKADPHALREEELTLTVLTNLPRGMLRDVVKYWLYIHDRQVKVTTARVTSDRQVRALRARAERKTATKGGKIA